MDVDILLSAAKAQMDDVLRVFSGKTLEMVKGNSSFKKDLLTESVFSLKDVAEKLYSIAIQMKKDDALSKCNKLMEEMKSLKQCLPEIIKDTIKSTGSVGSCQGNSESFSQNTGEKEDKQSHVIFLQEKDTDIKFDKTSWSTVVKGKLQKELKSIPIDKSIVNKNGQGCLFFPTKEAQEEAKSALEAHFEVTANSRPQKTVMPKIKVFDVDTEIYKNKSDLKQAILSKNIGVANLMSKDDDLTVVLLDVTRSYAILKVLPTIRKQMIKQGKVFLGMQSVKVRDHFQPLQCFACQRYGHKQGSPDCKHYNKNSSTCLYCSENHFSRDCPVKKDANKYKCPNCSSSSDHKHHVSHKSTSLKCPFVIKEMNSLLQRTAGINEQEAKKLKISIH